MAAEGKDGVAGLAADIQAMIDAYDSAAEATGWYAGEVAFGLAYRYIEPGQSLLDLGIGTGLSSKLFRRAGLEVYGLDMAPTMLAACRHKGYGNLSQHDLMQVPYPYESASIDHSLCLGVMLFLPDLSPVFQETARIVRQGGLFVFMTIHSNEDESSQQDVPGHKPSGELVQILRHSTPEIDVLCDRNGFRQSRSLLFTAYADETRQVPLQAKVYLTTRG